METMVKKVSLLLIMIACAAGLAGQAPKQPYRAMLYSAAFPGGGQLYNGKYLKAGLVAGIQGYLIYAAVHNDSRRQDFRELAENASSPGDQALYEARSRDYKDRLNNDIWWIGITAGLSMIDAYVDAHLHDFESEKERVRLRFGQSGLSLEFGF